jgi:hypothetical protein
MILFKEQLFDLEVKGQVPTKVIMVRDTPPYGHAPTYQISLTYQKSSSLKLLCQNEPKFGRKHLFCIKFPQSRMKGERHRLSPLVLDI